MSEVVAGPMILLEGVLGRERASGARDPPRVLAVHVDA